jgi:hypothetical protein
MDETPIRKITGAIRPLQASPNFNREAWCQFILGEAEFRRRPGREVPNPFKPGTMMIVNPAADSAEVMLDGRPVGSVSWSMSDEPLVIVEVEPLAMPLVQKWAAAMGGEFREEHWEE